MTGRPYVIAQRSIFVIHHKLANIMHHSRVEATGDYGTLQTNSIRMVLCNMMRVSNVHENFATNDLISVSPSGSLQGYISSPAHQFSVLFARGTSYAFPVCCSTILPPSVVVPVRTPKNVVCKAQYFWDIV